LTLFWFLDIPIIDCKAKLIGNGLADIDTVLNHEMGFKIPILNPKYVQQFPNIFEFGDWPYSGSVLTWIEHNLIGSSEHSVISLDSAWEGIIQGFLPGLTFYRDQHDPSSLPRERPDLTVVFNRCIVLKSEAKLQEKEMDNAELSLTEKFQGKAFQMFPLSSQSIIGVCSSETLIKIFKVSYNFELKKYESIPFPNAVYRVQQLQERVNFLVDILKFVKWICTVNRPINAFHLFPNVRTPTSNHHYVTWNGTSIIKELKGKSTMDLQHIERIYQERLPNVEYGEILRNTHVPTIKIDRIGRTLKDAIASGTISKDKACRDIEAGIRQLRELGLGHGDIKLNNIFVDDENVAFLDDLEYCAPHGTIIPKERRSSASNARKIEEFDLWRFEELKVEIAKL
jgi:hypothetical protein